MKNRRVIAFDADDTLWHNETNFEHFQAHYRALLAHYQPAATVDQALLATERRNIELYGYGIKGFTLSSIETAVDLSAGRITAEEIKTILQLGRAMLAHPIELLDGVADTLATLAGSHRLLVITKGDLRDQERKLAKSGLAARFHHIEIVSEKDESTYAAILRRHSIAPGEFLMVGNSLKSDILPVLALGAAGVHVPYHLAWGLEHTEQLPDADAPFVQLKSLRELPALLRD